MARSLVAAEKMATTGLDDSQDTQYLALVYNMHTEGANFRERDRNLTDALQSIATDFLPSPTLLEYPPEPTPKGPDKASSADLYGATNGQTSLTEQSARSQSSQAIFFSHEDEAFESVPVAVNPPPTLNPGPSHIGKKYDRIRRKNNSATKIICPRMEGYSPHQASEEGSLLSATQENTPGIYEKYSRIDNAGAEQGLAFSENDVQEPQAVQEDLSQVSHSYEEDDTGAVKFSFPEVPAHHDMDFDDEDLGPANVGFDPQTPAPIRPPIQNVGSVMGATQLFAATQPSSPGAGDIVEPSSARPSPDVYNDFTSPKRASSSPLLRRVHQSARSTQFTSDALTTPLQPPHRSSSGNDEINNNEIDRPKSSVPFISSNLLHRADTEPLDTYVSRRQSQERRQLKMSLSADHNSQASDDDYMDLVTDRRLESKRRKDNAAKELANVNISMTPKITDADDVEVPGTNRRRSVSEEYIAQCHGTDARDSQMEMRIADSQSRPPDGLPGHQSGDSISNPDEDDEAQDDDVVVVETSSGTNQVQNMSKSSPPKTSPDVPDQLPALDLHSDSLETSSEVDTSDQPYGNHSTQALSEISANRNSNNVRGPQKAALLSEGDRLIGLVPETSPPNDGSRAFGDIDDETVPTPSYPEPDLALFSLTQDDEFNALVSTSSPVRPANRRSFRRSTQKALPQESSGLSGSAKSEESRPNVGPSLKEPQKSSHETSTGLIESNVAEASEYVSALEHPIASSSSTLSTLSGFSSLDETNNSGSKQPNDRESPVLISSGVPQSGLSAESTPDTRTTPSTSHYTSPATTTSRPESTVKRTGLRSADKLKGPSRALRGKVFNEDPTPSKRIPIHVEPVSEPVSESKPSTRSSRRQSKRISSKTNTPEPEHVTPLRSKPVKVSAARPKSGALFQNMAFSVSYGSNEQEKLKVIRLITDNGGRLLHEGFDELFDMASSGILSPSKPSEKGDTTPSQLCLTAEAQEIGFTCLIADDHSRRPKYMQALALGLPCVSGIWIEHCIAKKEIISWDPYLLAAGLSTFLGNAVRSRTLQPYDAKSAKFADDFASRKKLLDNQSILLVVGRGRVEERKKAYLFLTQALGAQNVQRVTSNAEARKSLLEADREGKPFDWVYVAEREDEAEKAIFGTEASRKRKRGSGGADDAGEAQAPKRVRIVSDEYVIQSLILGKFFD